MRILMLTNLYPPHDIGGYEQWCQEVADGLRHKGHQVAVLTSTYRSRSDTPADDPHVARTLNLQCDLDYYRMSDFFLRRPFQMRSNRRNLADIIERFNPDVVFVWGMWSLSHNLPFWAEQLRPGRVAYFVSSYWPIDQDPHRQYWSLPTNRLAMELVKGPLRFLATRQLKRENYPPALRFDRAVCCSHFVRDRLVSAGKLPKTAGVIYGGCDPDTFSGYERPPAAGSALRLLYFGRLIHDKGVHTAVEALGHLKMLGGLERVTLTILGSGHPDYEAKLRQRVDLLDIHNHVVFKEKIAREEVPQELARHDAFLFTSIWPEPMARSVMEAMAAGLLVIGTPVGGQQEMLSDGQNALTFPAGDAAALAGQISYVLDDPQALKKLAGRGQQLVREKFTIDRMVNDIEQFLYETVAVPA